MGFSLSNFLGNTSDPAGVFGGDKGDIANNLFDPGGGFLENMGVDLGNYGDWREDASNYFDDLGDTNELLTENRRKNYRNNNGFERDALTGFSGFGGSSVGTKFTNEVFHKDDKPMWDMYGGFNQGDYQYAEDHGQDTSNKQGLHAVGSGIGKGFLNAFTAGLGSSAIDGLDNWGTGESNDDLVKKAAINYLANQYGGNVADSNVAGSVGMSGATASVANNTLGGATAGGISSGLSGDSVKDGMGQGALNGFVQSGGRVAMDGLGGMFNNNDEMDIYDERNTGTLGGTMENQYGERSSPGNLLPVQAEANAQANPGLSQRSQLQENPTMSKQSLSPNVQAFVQSNSPQGGGGGKSDAGGYGDLAASLYGMYNARKQRKELQGQQRDLQNLFSPNSPYAQHMRERMERKDAASGRRSQYGPREAQLAALLADRQAQTMPQQMKYSEGIGGLDNSFGRNLINFGQQAYKQYPKIGQDLSNGGNYLMNIFEGGK